MAKQASLAAQSGQLTVALKLPDIFTAPQEKVVSRYVAPYIVFAHPKRADEWAKLLGKFGNNVTEGSMFLIEQDKQTQLETAKLGIICLKQYWAQSNPAGNELVAASFVERPKPYKEHIEAVVLAYLNDRVIPANISFRSAKCPAGKTLADALAECQTPAWADKGAEFRDSLAVSQPFARFYGLVTVGPARTAKGSGLTYRPTLCTIKPTSTPEWQLLDAFSKDETSQKRLMDAAERFQTRIAEVTKKVTA